MGDEFVYNEKEEYEDVVKKVSKAFNYTEELQVSLKRVLPAMLEGKSYEEKQIFYKMLIHTPIIICDDIEETSKEYFRNVNPHISEAEAPEKNRGAIVVDGRFVCMPVLDKDLNILDTKQAVFVKRVPLQEKSVSFFGTTINIPHLIHELGHAFSSEEKHYIIKDGIIEERIGASSLKTTYEKKADGSYVAHPGIPSNVLIEETMNSLEEESAIKRYLRINEEQLLELYNSGILQKSTYQQIPIYVMERILNTSLKKEFEDLRMHKNPQALERINTILGQLDSYKKRKEATTFNMQKEKTFKKIEENITNSGSQLSEGTFFKGKKEFIKEVLPEFIGSKADLSPIEYFNSMLSQLNYICSSKGLLSITEYAELKDVCVDEVIEFICQLEKVEYKEEAFRE